MKQSLKLKSLPNDLRAEADKLLAKKFPEPEVVEKRPYNPMGRTVQFPPPIDTMAAFSGDENFATATQTVSQPTQSTIDKYSLERLQSYRGMDDRHQITFQFRVSPIGGFPTLGIDHYQFMQRIRNEHIEITVSGRQIHLVEAHLQQRLKALEVLYQGYFHCSLDRDEVRMIDGMYGMYPF